MLPNPHLDSQLHVSLSAALTVGAALLAMARTWWNRTPTPPFGTTASESHASPPTAMDQLVAKAAARFLDLPAGRIDLGLDQTLADLGALTGVDRCHVMRFATDQQEMSCLSEWTRPGVPSAKGLANQLSISEQEWWRVRMCRGEPVAFASIDEVSDHVLRRALERYDMASVLNLPLLHAGKPLGFLGLSTVLQQHPWHEREIGALKLLANVTASAIARSDAERRLIEREQDLRIILDAITDAVIATDANGRITRLNPVAERLLGWAHSEAKGYHFNEIVTIVDSSTNQARTDLLTLAAEGRLTPTGRAKLRSRDGSDHSVQESGGPLRGPDDRVMGMVLVFHDVTDQRQLEDMLRQSHKMDAIGQLAGGVAHDFNNMLAGILGFAELLSTRLVDRPEDERIAIRIVRAAERAAGLTRQLLAFSRKGKLVSRSVDMHRIAEETVVLLRRTIDPRIEISTNFQAENTVTEGDPAMIENALINLGLNARDAMPEGGLLTISTINRDLEFGDPLVTSFEIPPGRYVELTVRDTGAGMAPEVLSKIFTPFFTTKEMGKGTGLGLAAVYGIMREHRGAVIVDSKPGAGATFSLYFPLAGEQLVIETRTFRRPRLGSGCVLVIDDEDAVREMAAIALRDLGYEVIEAADGHSGLDTFALHHERIGLVILDLVMPRMHGRDVFARLRQIDDDIPVLISSGFSQDAKLDQLLTQPNTNFLQKPYRIPVLSQTVAEMMRAD